MTQVRGKFTLITGTMFVKKSLWLLDQIKQAKKNGTYYLCISTTKHEIKSRASEFVVPAAQISPDDPIELQDLLKTCYQEHGEYPEIVFIDEVQFIHPSGIRVLDWMLSEGINIVAAGLTYDFRHQIFPIIQDIFKYQILSAHLEHAMKCQICNDKEATHNQRLLYGQPNTTGPLIALDGDVYTYEARCGDCYQS